MRITGLLKGSLALALFLAPSAFAQEEGAGAGAPGARRAPRRAGPGAPGQRGGARAMGFMGRIREEFKALDADGDGTLSVREYARSVFARREFLGADKDRDGRLSKEEFVGYRPSFFRRPRPGAPPGARPRRPGLEGLIQRLDKDGDGAITEEEAGRAWGFLGRSDADGDGKVTADELKQAQAEREKQMEARRTEEFGRLDKNADGSISFAELLARPARRPGAPRRGPGAAGPRPEGPRQPRARLRELDKDGDGKISKEEFPGPDERFSRLDRNGDGFIDQEEVRGAFRRRPRNP